MSLDPNIMGKLREWKASALQFVVECIGAKPSNQQVEALKALPHKNRISIRSGHGTGKDALASWATLWFLTTRPYSKIVATAPTARQLGDVLWSEIHKWLRQSLVKDEFIWQKDKIYHRDGKQEWWARAVSPNVRASKEEQAETLAGFHADHIMVIVDEASGVTDPVFIPLEGILTGDDNKVLLISNPTRTEGYFYDTHEHKRIAKAWHKLHWRSNESSIVKGDFVQYFEDKYGLDSNIYSIRVLGDFASEDDNVLIPLAWSEACIGNDVGEPLESDPLFLGVDVARYGEDASVILPRHTNTIFPWRLYKGMNVIEFGGNIIHNYHELEAEGIAVDAIGLGGTLVDWLWKTPGIARTRVHDVQVHMKSGDPNKWDSIRSELWLRVRDKVERAAYCFPMGDAGHDLASELASPNYSFNNKGAYVIESKRSMKKRGRVSPNIADALCLTEYFADNASRMFRDVKKKTRKRDKFKAPAMAGAYQVS